MRKRGKVAEEFFWIESQMRKNEVAMNSLEKSFGKRALQKGYITTDQLQDALKVRMKELNGNGSHRFLHTIMLSLDYVTHDQVENIIKEINPLA